MGAPTGGIVPADFTEPEVFFQIGVEPVRVDILTSVPGLEFTAAWTRRVTIDFGGVTAGVLSWADVQAAKTASGRKRDRTELRTAAKRTPKEAVRRLMARSTGPDQNSSRTEYCNCRP